MPQRIAQLIQQQMETNRSKNLLYAQAALEMEADPEFVAALEQLLARDPAPDAAPDTADPSGTEDAPRKPGAPHSAKAQEFAARALLKRLYAINQYVQVPQAQIEELQALYRDTWETMRRTRNVRNTLAAEHYPRLAQWLAALYPDEWVEKLSTTPTVGQVVCSEYSAQLQLDLLGIDRTQLREPLLDIGCGSNARLVRYLRAQHIAAFGIDRLLDVRADYLTQTDWFAYRFAPGHWGTLVSNMAFSNHAAFAQHHNPARFARCRTKYRQMLASLVPGGSFHYAPGLPAFEQELDPQRYRIERRPLFDGLAAVQVTRRMDAGAKNARGNQPAKA